MAALAVATATPAAAAAPEPAANSWHVAATLGLGRDDTATSCPISSRCWAIEAGKLLSSEDGGHSWTSRTALVPAEVAALNDLDCPAADTCYASATRNDGGVGVLRFGAGTVQDLDVPGATALPAISCASSLLCVATDGRAVFVTTDGGAAWQQHPLARFIYSRPAIACVRHSTRCWVVGDNAEVPVVERTVDDGASWSTQLAPSGPAGLQDIACPSASTCYAVGPDASNAATAIGTTDGGATWIRQPTPAHAFPLRSVSCAVVDTCWATGGPSAGSAGPPYVFVTTDTGGHWAEQDLGSQYGAGTPAVSCPTTLGCAAVSQGLAFWTTDAGANWQSTEVESAPRTPGTVSCPTRTWCVALSSDALGHPVSLTSPDGGVSWSTHPLPVSAGIIACPSVIVCHAVGSQQVAGASRFVTQAVSSSDGGRSWHLDRVVAGSGVLLDLSCPTAQACLAVGYVGDRAKVLQTVDSGASWHAVDGPVGVPELDHVACATTTACAFIGTQSPGSAVPIAFTSADFGATYQVRELPPLEYLLDLDCAGSTCVTVGRVDNFHEAIVVSHDAGATWAARPPPAGAVYLYYVSCGNAAACAVTAYATHRDAGAVVGTTDAGQTWRAFALPSGEGAPSAIDCAANACLAAETSVAGNPRFVAGRA